MKIAFRYRLSCGSPEMLRGNRPGAPCSYIWPTMSVMARGSHGGPLSVSPSPLFTFIIVGTDLPI